MKTERVITLSVPESVYQKINEGYPLDPADLAALSHCCENPEDETYTWPDPFLPPADFVADDTDEDREALRQKYLGQGVEWIEYTYSYSCQHRTFDLEGAEGEDLLEFFEGYELEDGSYMDLGGVMYWDLKLNALRIEQGVFEEIRKDTVEWK